MCNSVGDVVCVCVCVPAAVSVFTAQWRGLLRGQSARPPG